MTFVGWVVLLCALFPRDLGEWAAKVRIGMEDAYPGLRVDQDAKIRMKQEKKDRKAARKGH